MDTGYLSEAFVSFQGEGLHVGRRQLFLRFAGCPLRCRYCDTPDSLVRGESFVVHAGVEERRPNPVSIDDISWAIETLGVPRRSLDGTAITGGEPLAQADFLVTLLRSGVLPRPRLLETAGVLPDELSKVVEEIDVVSMDIKLPSNTGETAFWDEHRRFLQRAGHKAYVKILVDLATSDDDVHRATSLIAAAETPVPVFLQPITTRKASTLIDAERLSRLFDVARSRLQDVRVVPQTHKIMQLR
jgi:7-carboxy-7-deazaguanine synthase